MTNEELELKYPMALSLCVIECGWHGLIEQFLEELIKLPNGNAVILAQVKEKFGQLRIYEEFCPDEIRVEVCELMDKYEKLSRVTCEECGLPGTRRTGGWIRTLCDAHAKTNG